MSTVVELLHLASWRAERLFKQHGALHAVLWLTEDRDGTRAAFETTFAGNDTVPEREAWAALRAEIAADFSRDGIVRYALAFPATAHTVLSTTVLHHEGHQRATRNIIALEAHDDKTHLCSEREVLRNPPRLAALAPIKTMQRDDGVPMLRLING